MLQFSCSICAICAKICGIRATICATMNLVERIYFILNFRPKPVHLLWVIPLLLWFVLIPLEGDSQKLTKPIGIQINGMPKLKPATNYSLASLYWQYRIDGTIDQDKLNNLLKNVHLWRPTDEFPGNQNYDDRILPQLLWSASVQPKKIKRIAVLNRNSWTFVTKYATLEYFERECPNLANYCEYVDVNSRTTAEDIKDVDIFLTDFTNLRTKFSSGNLTRALFNLESSYSASTMQAHLEGTDILCTFWTGSDIVTNYGKWVYYDPLVKTKKQNRNYASGKTKMAAIMMSNCRPPNGRIRYVRKLINAGLSVDFYGKCGNLSCAVDDKNCSEMIKNDYKFYLAFENSNCDDYITEKFFRNGLGNDAVPVVMGAPLDDFLDKAPPNSFIHIDTFPSAQKLVEYLKFLDKNDTAYNEYFQWKGTGEIIKGKFLCRFCGMLHYADIVPVPVRNTSFDWNMHARRGKPPENQPCLRRGQFHWNSRKNY